MDLYADLQARGLVKQVTDLALEHALAQGPMTLYCGFDPTADCLHVGSMLPLLTLRRFQLAGHRVIAVVGGATGMVGDPSFKATERSLLDETTLARNVEGLRRVMTKFLDLSPGRGALVNNYDWFKGVEYLTFLRDVGKHFTINHMIAKESVRARLEDREHGISYTEFSYMLLQAYDFYVLNRTEGCRLQIGGSDQWGNITAGGELIRRMRAAASSAPLEDDEATAVYGMTMPLIMKADGTKFGKSESGNVWVSAERTSPYQFYQYFIQTADADVVNSLKYFTFLPLVEIADLERQTKDKPEARAAQRALAREMTRLVHGEAELASAEKAAQALFSGELASLDEKMLLEVLSGAPTTTIGRDRLTAEGGAPLVDLLVECGLCTSKGAARKDIQGGGISLNDRKVTDPAARVGPAELLAGRYVVARKGKRTYALIRIESA